jgi:5-methyltetrahydrofolate--homocysteine methyltransferase
MLTDLISNNWIEARAIVGFYPCNSNEEDDIEVYSSENAAERNVISKFHTLR